MYAQEIGKIAEEPNGAALTTPNDLDSFPIDANGFTTGCEGRNGARWDLTPIGPIPGPPPPLSEN